MDNRNRMDRALLDKNGKGSGGLGGISLLEKIPWLEDLIMQPWFAYILIGLIIILAIFVFVFLV
jgi:hypothetical protein